MKFTHRFVTSEGWDETNKSPSKFEKVKHLGECKIDGDMFVAYTSDGYIEIFKGTLEEETLKTNTWYKSKGFGSLVYRTGNKNNYGIYNNRSESKDWSCSNPTKWQEATEQEVKEALIKLSKKKGFKNIHKLKLKLINGYVFEKGTFEFENNNFRFENNILFLDGVIIFNKGKWAEILEEKQLLTILAIEERLKRLEDKLL